ncbi:BspA family leucine-rich repeat surface protein [Mycoplasmopsis bovis]|nr:BspA family leucine-rich repeat surface protein [Mycoplasmopsis bovis]
MSQMFFRLKKFNTDISSWKTNNVKNMIICFCQLKELIKNLDKWDTCKCYKYE